MIRSIVETKSGEHFHENIGISYSTILLEFKKLVGPFVDHISIYGTHSIKPGAASHPACRAINDTLLDKHAGWKCPKTTKRYVKHVAQNNGLVDSFDFALFALCRIGIIFCSVFSL